MKKKKRELLRLQDKILLMGIGLHDAEFDDFIARGNQFRRQFSSGIDLSSRAKCEAVLEAWNSDFRKIQRPLILYEHLRVANIIADM